MSHELDGLYDRLALCNKAKPKEVDVAGLRQYLAAHPEHSFVMGNLARQVQMQVIENAVPGTAGTRTSIDEFCNLLRSDLGYTDALPLERMLIKHVVLCWLRLHVCELRYELNLKDATLRQAEYWERKLSSNQKRYLRAVEALARIRKMGINVQVNIGDKQVITR